MAIKNDPLSNGRTRSEMKTLWSDMDKTRHFLIDDALQLPPGDFVLRTPSGKKRLVDPDAINDYEISKEEAKAWLKEQLGDVTQRLGAGLRDRSRSWPPHAEKDEAKRGQAVSDDEKKLIATPGLDLLADITETPREHLTDDYNAIGRSLRSYLGDVVSTIGDGVSGDRRREMLARKRMQQWSNVLKKHGIASADVTDTGEAAEDAAEQSTDCHNPSDATPKSETLKNRKKQGHEKN